MLKYRIQPGARCPSAPPVPPPAYERGSHIPLLFHPYIYFLAFNRKNFAHIMLSSLNLAKLIALLHTTRPNFSHVPTPPTTGAPLGR